MCVCRRDSNDKVIHTRAPQSSVVRRYPDRRGQVHCQVNSLGRGDCSRRGLLGAFRALLGGLARGDLAVLGVVTSLESRVKGILLPLLPLLSMFPIWSSIARYFLPQWFRELTDPYSVNPVFHDEACSMMKFSLTQLSRSLFSGFAWSCGAGNSRLDVAELDFLGPVQAVFRGLGGWQQIRAISMDCQTRPVRQSTPMVYEVADPLFSQSAGCLQLFAHRQDPTSLMHCTERVPHTCCTVSAKRYRCADVLSDTSLTGSLSAPNGSVARRGTVAFL